MSSTLQNIIIPRNKSFVSRKLKMDSSFKERHFHETIELTYIISGTGGLIIDGNTFNFIPDDIVFIGSGISHSWEFHKTDGEVVHKCISVHFSEDILNSNLFNVPELNEIANLMKDAGYGVVFRGNKVDRKFKLFEKLFTSDSLNSYIAMLKLFKSLITEKNRTLLKLSLTVSEVNDNDRKMIGKVYDYVLKNLEAGINLTDVSSLVYMDPSSFCRFFKKKTGQTFMDYVKYFRINYAATLLEETDKQISQICYECGYNNLSNFNYYFKQVLKQTPSEYRKSLKKSSR